MNLAWQTNHSLLLFMIAHHLPAFVYMFKPDPLLGMLLGLPLSLSNLQTLPCLSPRVHVTRCTLPEACPLFTPSASGVCCTSSSLTSCALQHLWAWLCHKIGIGEGHRGPALANQEGLFKEGDDLVETEGEVSKRKKKISLHSEHPQPAFFPSFPRSHFLFYIIVMFFHLFYHPY